MLYEVITFESYCEKKKIGNALANVSQNIIREYIDELNESNMSASSQARALSGIKSFFKS